jgi:Spy/CpxP family protein refolding chaperone
MRIGKESAMKKKIGLAAGCMLLIILMSSTLTHGAAREGSALTVRWWEQPQYIEILGLTDQQVDSIKEKYQKDSGKLNKIRVDIKRQRSVLAKQILEGKHDEGHTAALVDKLAASVSEEIKTELSIRISLIKELTDEQRAKFREIDKRKYSDRYK